jgi:hypothetical protein
MFIIIIIIIIIIIKELNWIELLFSQHNSGMNTPRVSLFYVFRHIAAIVRYEYIELSESLHNPSAIPPYTGQCLHIGSALYKYFVSVIPLCYKIY